MSKLSEAHCEACRADAPRVSDDEARDLMKEIPDWERQDVGGVPRLVRAFAFPDFAAALEFTNRVGGIAEEQGHHPALLTEWGQVTVSWWTHKIRGLHRNDFVMAARTDELAG